MSDNKNFKKKSVHLSLQLISEFMHKNEIENCLIFLSFSLNCSTKYSEYITINKIINNLINKINENLNNNAKSNHLYYNFILHKLYEIKTNLDQKKNILYQINNFFNTHVTNFYSFKIKQKIKPIEYNIKEM